jgi:glycosyltransferase involved in cell wall biosynthesis
MKLSIIIPCYNEKDTLLEIVKKVEDAPIGNVEKEIIVIDDASTDGTQELASRELNGHKVIFNEKNEGKGACIRKAIEHVTGDMVIIQDADLEYDPRDYAALIAPLISRKHRVVYGSRERNKENKAHSGWRFYFGGLFVTWFANLLYGSKLTDEPTCYKVFDAKLLRSISLQSRRFEFCPEVTAKILKRGVKIKELPILISWVAKE